MFLQVIKTGRCIVSHEAPYTGGFGAELAASIQVCIHALGLAPDPTPTLVPTCVATPTLNKSLTFALAVCKVLH